MRLLSAAIALAATMCLSAPSLAATVQQVQGQVFVNTGTGFQPVLSGQTANPGALVLARAGGGGQVVYPDGCVVPIGGNNPIHRVLPQSPCVNQQEVGYAYYLVPALAVAGGVTAIILLTQNDDDDDLPASP